MKRKGFTLIELVIVVAIIGILALMIIPQFNNVTKDAKLKTFESNCKVVTSAIVMYQAGHKGDYPPSGEALNEYLNIEGGFSKLQGNPTGASYTITAAGANGTGFKFVGSYNDGEAHTYNYPATTTSGGGGNTPAPQT